MLNKAKMLLSVKACKVKVIILGSVILLSACLSGEQVPPAPITIFPDTASSISTPSPAGENPTTFVSPALLIASTALDIGFQKVSPVDGMIMVYVPAGGFLMGSTSEDPLADDDEKPQRRVFLDAFWIDQTEVTNEMYAAFLNDQGNKFEGGDTWLDADDPAVRLKHVDGNWQSEVGYEDHPVIEVNWFGARAYCEWAGRRLPTEAEWEKAARGTDGRTYPWGEGKPSVVQLTCDQANFAGCEFDTRSVGKSLSFASPYGILDMSGNIAEWVADWYDADYYETATNRNPQGPTSGTYRVMRGGSWSRNFRMSRTASRDRSDPGFACFYNGEGFRCADSP